MFLADITAVAVGPSHEGVEELGTNVTSAAFTFTVIVNHDSTTRTVPKRSIFIHFVPRVRPLVYDIPRVYHHVIASRGLEC
jgi:hypothetical protein